MYGMPRRIISGISLMGRLIPERRDIGIPAYSWQMIRSQSSSGTGILTGVGTRRVILKLRRDVPMEEERPFMEIKDGENLLMKADTAILVPADSPDYPDRLTGCVAGSEADAKHTYHALSQIALYDYEDKVLEVETIQPGHPLRACNKGSDSSLDKGLIIVRDMSGKIRILAHRGVGVYDLLKFAHRHCTRWIRLDI